MLNKICHIAPSYNNILFFKTNMSGSHGGSSGRFKRLEERALEYSWMMGLLGMTGEAMKQ